MKLTIFVFLIIAHIAITFAYPAEPTVIEQNDSIALAPTIDEVAAFDIANDNLTRDKRHRGGYGGYGYGKSNLISENLS